MMCVMKIIKNYKMLTLALTCLTLLILTAVLPVVHIISWLGQDSIIISINSYLNESQRIARNDFVKLSELSALLAPLQSSEVGISFIVDVQVGVGQLLESFTKLVVDAAEVSVLVISTIEIIKYSLSLSEMITPWLFLMVLAAGVLYGFNHSFTGGRGAYSLIGNRFVKIVITLFLVLHIFLPYSLYGAALFSKHLIDDSKAANHSVLNNLHQHMGATHKKEGLKDRAENAIHSFEKIVLDVPRKVEAMAIYHARHMAMSLFEFIVLPIALFAIAIITIYGVIRTDRVSLSSSLSELKKG